MPCDGPRPGLAIRGRGTFAPHDTKNDPLHFAGGNALGFKHGKLHVFEGDKKVPLANLFVSMPSAIDVPTETFADSTGEMSELLV